MAHPVLDAVACLDEALKTVADVNPTFMTAAEKATALTDLVRVEARVAELRLRIMAVADDLAAATGAHDAAQWLTVRTRVRHEDARADLRLAHALDRRWTVLATAMRAGEVSTAQAQVVAGALDQLPGEVDDQTRARAEEALVGYAADFGPRQLARLGRRILDLVAPEVAEAAEARRLAAVEADARRRTRFGMRRLGDGTTRISGLVPDAVATRLATYLEAFTNPRKHPTHPQSAQSAEGAAEGADPFTRLPYPRRLGEAFCQFLEAVDPSRLPVHGGDATTVIVTIDLDRLRADLGTAELIGAGHVPGDDAPVGLSASQVRRLACTAGIIPVVLGEQSEILDVGRLQRLFTAAQRRALVIRDRACRAEGCDIPGTWCEAHHWIPWARGGPTDLDNAALLCHHHHHRVHDHDYLTERLPNGDVRFSRRT